MPSGRRRPLRYVLVAVSIVAVVLIGVGSRGLWYRFTGPAIPMPDMTGVDPAVVKAVNIVRRNVQEHPGSADGWGTLGKVLRIHGFDAESIASFTQAERLNPDDPRWPFFLGEVLRTTDPEEATRCLRRAVQKGGKVFSPRLVLAEVLIDQDHADDAESVLAPVLKQEPNNARALLAMGRVAMSRGRFEEAVELLKRSVTEAPSIQATHSALAVAYGKLGLAAPAERETRVAAASSEAGGWPDPYREEALRLWVGERAASTHARRLWAEGRPLEAVAVYREVVRNYPHSVSAQFSLGDRLNLLKNYLEAEGPLREAIRLDPKFGRAQFALGYALNEQGKSSEAENHFHEVVRLQPDFAVGYYYLSLTLAERDRSGSLEAIEKAIQLEPGLEAAHRQRARLLALAGRYADARVALLRAQELSRSPQESQAQQLSRDQLPDLVTPPFN